MFEKKKSVIRLDIVEFKRLILYEATFLLRENVLHPGSNQIGIYYVVPKDFLLISNGRLTWSSASGLNCSTG